MARPPYEPAGCRLQSASRTAVGIRVPSAAARGEPWTGVVLVRVDRWLVALGHACGSDTHPIFIVTCPIGLGLVRGEAGVAVGRVRDVAGARGAGGGRRGQWL